MVTPNAKDNFHIQPDENICLDKLNENIYVIIQSDDHTYLIIEPNNSQ
jgi:hypothetical protein